MTMNHPTAGPNSVPAYQISGVPYVVTGSATSTVTTHSFPYVTRDIYIKSRGDSIRVGFTHSGTLGGGNAFKLNVSESVILEVRTTQLFIVSTAGSVPYEVVAGLTGIYAKDFPILTASNEFTGVG